MIEFTINGAVGVITLQRAPVNAINDEMLVGLANILDRIERDDSLKVLLINSEGKCFCAGADIEMLRRWTEHDAGAEEQDAFASKLQRTFGRIAKLSIPTIAAIHGAATGGGLEMALACDLRIVAAEASLGLTEVRLGLLPGAGGTQRLTQLLGRSAALRLMLRGEIFKGDDAKAMGLAEFCVPRADVQATAFELAGEIARWPRSALLGIKACVLGVGNDGYLLESEFTRALAREPETKNLIAEFFSSRR